MISEISILFFKASLTIRHTATVSQKKSGTSKKIQWDFQISRVGSLDFLDLKVNGSPDKRACCFLDFLYKVMLDVPTIKFLVMSGFEVIKLFSCSTQLYTKFILLINVKMPTIVGILTFISMINTTSERLSPRFTLFVGILVFMSC